MNSNADAMVRTLIYLLIYMNHYVPPSAQRT